MALEVLVIVPRALLCIVSSKSKLKPNGKGVLRLEESLLIPGSSDAYLTTPRWDGTITRI